MTDREYFRSLDYQDFVWGLKGIHRDKDETQMYATRHDIGLNIIEELRGMNHHFIKIFQRFQFLAGKHPTKFWAESLLNDCGNCFGFTTSTAKVSPDQQTGG
jgi:hypothetical protein